MVLCTGQAFGQKGKIKQEAVQGDSAKANVGKAAIRGGTLMQASRDSLRAASLEPPRVVVDTFETDSNAYSQRSFLSVKQLDAADLRLQENRTALADAAKQLATTEAKERYSEKELADAKARLEQQEKRLDVLQARLDAIRSDWEASKGLDKPKDAAGAEGSPASPK